MKYPCRTMKDGLNKAWAPKSNGKIMKLISLYPEIKDQLQTAIKRIQEALSAETNHAGIVITDRRCGIQEPLHMRGQNILEGQHSL